MIDFTGKQISSRGLVFKSVPAKPTFQKHFIPNTRTITQLRKNINIINKRNKTNKHIKQTKHVIIQNLNSSNQLTKLHKERRNTHELNNIDTYIIRSDILVALQKT